MPFAGADFSFSRSFPPIRRSGHCRFAGADFSFSRSFPLISPHSGNSGVAAGSRQTRRDLRRVVYVIRYRHSTNVRKGTPGVIDIALMLERWHQAPQGANDTSFSSKCESPGHWMPSRKSLCGDRWRQRSSCRFPGQDHIRPGNYLSSAYTCPETARSLLSGEPSRRFRPASQSCRAHSALSPCPVETNRPRLYPTTPRSTVSVKPQSTVHFLRRNGRLPVRSCVYGRLQLPSELCGKLCIGAEVFVHLPKTLDYDS